MPTKAQGTGTWQTGLEKLRQLWAAGDYHKALALAASWPRLGTYKVAIQRGHAAASPLTARAYAEMGYDCGQLVADGLAALAARYNLPDSSTAPPPPPAGWRHLPVPTYRQPAVGEWYFTTPTAQRHGATPHKTTASAPTGWIITKEPVNDK